MVKTTTTNWLKSSTFRHLRLPFSFFLLPVFLFAVSQTTKIDLSHAVIAFLVLHLLLFPSSNGYNSYQDQDETSIGGLKHPPRVTRELFWVTLGMDGMAIALSLLVSVTFSAMVSLFILVSRAYSYRRIRLKRYAIIGFLTVFVFQGAFVFLMSLVALSGVAPSGWASSESLACMAISSLFIGSMYPLTQIYQHEADRQDGVISISYKLGYRGTFVFSAILFVLATGLLFWYFKFQHRPFDLWLFVVVIIPAVYHLNSWFSLVRQNTAHASFENTMKMNVVTASCMNLYFVALIILHRFF